MKFPERPTDVDLYLANPYPLPSLTRSPQEPPKDPIDIKIAVGIALENYPAIRAAKERALAAGAGIDLANTTYLPRVDLLWQEIRATRNNISGTLIPNPVIPGISGSVSPTASWQNGWGSNSGALLSWEPFDFGYRGSLVEIARAAEKEARARVDITRLDVATSASEAFLALLAAQETARAAQANVDRRDVFAKSVHALVTQQLRPGADASRADAELAQAQIQLVQAQETVARGKATLLETLGLVQAPIAIDAGPLLRLPLRSEVPSPDFKSHPLTQSQSAAVESALARQKALETAYYPRFNLQGGLYGRGSQFDSTGKLLDGDEGVLPDRGNWVVGVSIYFPAFEIFQIGARKSIEERNANAERARLDQVALGLQAEESRLRAALAAVRDIVTKTPVQLKAAQEAHTQATTRYQNGLGTLPEVADAQQILARAEIDDALARLSVWRVLSQAAKVQGDIAPFLDVVANTPR
jgi:outer membrane protein TolC